MIAVSQPRAERGVIARSEIPRFAGKQSHRWDRPARNAGLPVIRHPGLRSGVQSGFPRTRE